MKLTVHVTHSSGHIISQAETSGCVRQLVSDFLCSVTDDEIVTSVEN